MKKIAIFIENQFDEQELIYPYHRLREDFEVVLVGTEANAEYKSKSGLVMKSDISSKEAVSEDFEGLYIPGGFSPDYMRRCPESVSFAQRIAEEGKPIAAICHGPWMLISSLDLKGKEVTSFPSIRKDLENAGARWLDQEVVVSDKIVTSRTPKDLPANLKAFLELLKVSEIKNPTGDSEEDGDKKLF